MSVAGNATLVGTGAVISSAAGYRAAFTVAVGLAAAAALTGALARSQHRRVCTADCAPLTVHGLTVRLLASGTHVRKYSAAQSNPWDLRVR